jgi:hypothetical protein
VIKASQAVPFAKAVLSADLLSLRVGNAVGESFNGREDGLNATIEWRAVEALDGGIKSLQMSSELVRLVNTMT